MRISKWLVLVCALCVWSALSLSGGTLTQSASDLPDSAPRVTIKTVQDGIPSAVLYWDAFQLSKNDEFETKREAHSHDLRGKSPVPFNTMFVSWQSTKPHADLSGFQVMVSTRADGGTWPEWWKVTGGKCCLECEPVMMYMTYATTGEDQLHTDFEVQVEAPPGVVITSMRLWFIDVTDPTTDLEGGLPFEKHNERSNPVSGLVGTASQPLIIPRSEWWGNLPPGEITAPRRLANYRDRAITITHSVIHHTFTTAPSDVAVAKSTIRAIWAFHALQPTLEHPDRRNWGDIGYNFIIDPFGNIYQGTFNTNLSVTDVWGIHAGNANSHSVGVALLGRFHPPQPPVETPASLALRSLERLLAWRFNQRALDPLGMANINTAWGIRNIHRIAGHRDVSATACPGDNLWNLLPAIRTNVRALIPPQLRVSPATVAGSLAPGAGLTTI